MLIHAYYHMLLVYIRLQQNTPYSSYQANNIAIYSCTIKLLKIHVALLNSYRAILCMKDITLLVLTVLL